MYVVATTKRPVPLRHYIYTGNSKQTSNELFEIVNKKEIDKLRYLRIVVCMYACVYVRTCVYICIGASLTPSLY